MKFAAVKAAAAKAAAEKAVAEKEVKARATAAVMEKKIGLRGAWVVLDEAAKEGRRADALVIIRKHVRRLVSTCGMVSMVST